MSVPLFLLISIFWIGVSAQLAWLIHDFSSQPSATH